MYGLGSSKWGCWVALGVVQVALTIVAGACGGCDTPSGSCEGVDFGLIRVLVLDQDDNPVPGAPACAWTVCASTQANGAVELAVRSGLEHRTWIELPAGYVQGSDPLEQSVTVVKDQTTQAEFRLVRTP